MKYCTGPRQVTVILKLPSSASNEQRKTYKRLQKEVHKSSKNHSSHRECCRSYF
ncbi:hypothetical protein BASA60_005252, partial [Batrachochytrium salamandrivorans]